MARKAKRRASQTFLEVETLADLRWIVEQTAESDVDSVVTLVPTQNLTTQHIVITETQAEANGQART